MGLSPNNSAARNLRGFAYKGMGDLNRALPDLDEAIRLAPNLARAYANRGDVYREKGDLDRAIADSAKRSGSHRIIRRPIRAAGSPTSRRATSILRAPISPPPWRCRRPGPSPQRRTRDGAHAARRT